MLLTLYPTIYTLNIAITILYYCDSYHVTHYLHVIYYLPQGIPLADCFKVLQYWTFEKNRNMTGGESGEASNDTTMVTVGLYIHYIKSTMMKGQVTSGVKEELIGLSKRWLAHSVRIMTASYTATPTSDLYTILDEPTITTGVRTCRTFSESHQVLVTSGNNTSVATTSTSSATSAGGGAVPGVHKPGPLHIFTDMIGAMTSRRNSPRSSARQGGEGADSDRTPIHDTAGSGNNNNKIQTSHTTPAATTNNNNNKSTILMNIFGIKITYQHFIVMLLVIFTIQTYYQFILINKINLLTNKINNFEGLLMKNIRKFK